jgi:hypothetical protein
MTHEKDKFDTLARHTTIEILAMTTKEKQKILIFLGLAVLMTALLATSLSQIAFQPGIPPPRFENNNLVLPEISQAEPVAIHVNTFLFYLIGLILSAYLLVASFRWVRGIAWKKLLVNLPKFFMLLLVVLIILLLFMLPGFSEKPLALTIPPPTQTPQFTPFDAPPSFLLWVVGIGLAILAAFLINTWLKTRRKPDRAGLLTVEAERAMQNILAGEDVNEVILRCYAQMSRVLLQEGGIEREAFMTPSEFEQELSSAGFPKAPVHQLTQLFEIARYGNWTPTLPDEQKALDSLQGIINHLRGKVTRNRER